MSWSITLIGNPEKVAAALEKHSETLSGKSKEEYDAALPHLLGLVKQNYNTVTAPVIKVTASGHGYENYNQCLCNIDNLGGTLV